MKRKAATNCMSRRKAAIVPDKNRGGSAIALRRQYTLVDARSFGCRVNAPNRWEGLNRLSQRREGRDEQAATEAAKNKKYERRIIIPPCDKARGVLFIGRSDLGISIQSRTGIGGGFEDTHDAAPATEQSTT